MARANASVRFRGWLHTTLLDEWAAAGAGPSVLPAPDEATWQLAAALRVGCMAARPASLASVELTLHCQGHTRLLRAPDPAVHLERIDGLVVHWRHAGVLRRSLAVSDGEQLHIVRDGATFTFTEASPYPARENRADPARARAPVAGVVARVAVAAGESVIAGQPLACIEAMKMEMWVHAAAAGTVRALHVTQGQSVAAGAVIVELELAP